MLNQLTLARPNRWVNNFQQHGFGQSRWSIYFYVMQWSTIEKDYSQEILNWINFYLSNQKWKHNKSKVGCFCSSSECKAFHQVKLSLVAFTCNRLVVVGSEQQLRAREKRSRSWVGLVGFSSLLLYFSDVTLYTVLYRIVSMQHLKCKSNLKLVGELSYALGRLAYSLNRC